MVLPFIFINFVRKTKIYMFDKISIFVHTIVTIKYNFVLFFILGNKRSIFTFFLKRSPTYFVIQYIYKEIWYVNLNSRLIKMYLQCLLSPCNYTQFITEELAKTSIQELKYWKKLNFKSLMLHRNLKNK